MLFLGLLLVLGTVLPCYCTVQVMLFAHRLQDDHDACPAALRKACTFQQGLNKLQCCAGFLHFLTALQKVAPPSDFADMSTSLRKQFSSGYLDPDIMHTLENTFPPEDPGSIGAFRPVSKL